MKRPILMAFLVSSSMLVGNIGPQGFGAFRNHYFVETGTFGGDGIKKALQAGFKMVLSIEHDQAIFNSVIGAFKKHANVKIFQGDSACDLWNMIKDIRVPITFWLDAHIYPPCTDGRKNCPVLAELEQIKQHPIKTHTILIDDMHCAGTAAFDYLTQEDFIKKIWEINPNYEISYVPGGNDGEYPYNVMVAQIH